MGGDLIYEVTPKGPFEVGLNLYHRGVNHLIILLLFATFVPIQELFCFTSMGSCFDFHHNVLQN